MSDIQDLLARQARWQKRRQALSWPEKIQLALKMRESIGMLRGRRVPAPAKPAAPD
jgi:hypothetical protein